MLALTFTSDWANLWARRVQNDSVYQIYLDIMARTKENRWLSMGDACQLLGVNESTLRHWADAGRLRAFRTPGGHRRFSREDIDGLTESGRTSGGRQAEGWPESALDGMRRRLQRRKGQAEGWYQHFDEEGKSRMRVLGRRLVSLAMDYISHKRRRAELTEEARYLGLEYGRELATGGVKLGDAIAAFIYFRTALHDAIGSGNSAQGAAQMRPDPRSEVLVLEDTVLLAIAEAYERS